MGGIVAGIQPRLAVSPHIAFALPTRIGVFLAVNEVVSIVPATDRLGVGIYSQTATDLGFAWDKVNVSAGPVFAAFTMPACKPDACRRVEGVLAGVHAQASFYFAGALGLSVWGSVDWLPGDSVILTEGFVAMVVAGPVLRWRTK